MRRGWQLVCLRIVFRDAVFVVVRNRRVGKALLLESVIVLLSVAERDIKGTKL